MADLPGGVTREHIRESNLIEGIDDREADASSEQAWRWLAAQGELRLDVVLNTHQLVTEAQLGKHAGKLRRVNVQVGGRICPPWRQVRARMEDWLRTMRMDWRTLGPCERHVAFERIHPFIDGNGRTGRLLMWWHQVKLGQDPILLRAAERQWYYEWFRAPGELDEYSRYLLRKIGRSGGGEQGG